MTITFENLSMHDIRTYFQPGLLDSAMQLVDEGRVTEYELENENKLSGIVVENYKRYYARLTMVHQTLNMACECGRLREGPCVHALALLLAWSLDHPKNNEASEAGELEDLPQPPERAEGHRTEPFISPVFQAASAQAIRTDWQSRLQSLTVKNLREIAAAWGVKLKGIIHDQVFNGLVDVVSAPHGLARVLDSLPPDTARVLDLLCVLAYTVPAFTSDQIRPYLQAALVGSGLQTRPVDDCLQDLIRLGLFTQSTFATVFPVPLQVLALPRSNPALLNPWKGIPPQIEAAQPFRFSRLALRMLLLAQSGRLQRAVHPRQGGADAWPLQTLVDKNLREIEINPEPIYLESGLRAALAQNLARPPEEVDLAARLLEAGGLWNPRAQKVAAKISAWLQISPREQSRRLFALAVTLSSQLELDLARSAGFTVWRSAYGAGYSAFLSGLGMARLRLVRLLSRLPAGQWFGIDVVLRMLHGLQPGWLPELISRQGGSAGEHYWDRLPIWASVGRRKLNPMDYADWSKAWGEFYHAMLTQSLPWLGLLDVGLQDGKAVAVRLSEFGEFLVDRRAEFPFPAVQSPAAPLTLNASGLLALDLDATPLDLIHLVLQIAQPEKSASGAPSPRSLLYRMSDSQLAQAFEAGWTLEAITAKLRDGLRAPLPREQDERLQRIWDHFGRLQIYEDLTLIELADDFALPELLAGSSLSQILLHTFSPRLVAVRSSAADAFIAELQAKGYTPRLEGGARG